MPLRVIGGTQGGRTLKGPPRTGVRPTADRVREALFEILAARDVPMSRVLDLYSGTGALGIEALSRGAEYCDFVEADSKACDVIRENLNRTRFSDRAKVWPLQVAKALARLNGPYDLVAADPPYEYDRAEKELTQVLESGLLSLEGTLVVEHSQRKLWPQELAGFRQLTSRRYGDTRITFYVKGID
ncbi:MAG TPA: 16S rRNA (guanine(966)-N(2))-methyltransferase RsmD [Dehalococcoidia bacterium]|nr:16S rRNA (guanine(966)-N(2))-methyltransferase RsmD [Dehalococcoidia bacterium]